MQPFEGNWRLMFENEFDTPDLCLGALSIIGIHWEIPKVWVQMNGRGIKELSHDVTNKVIEIWLSVMISQISCESILVTPKPTTNMGNNVPTRNENFNTSFFL